MTPFTPSPEQSLIFSSTGNIIVEAVAGSGKTTTIVEFLLRLPKTNGLIPPAILFLAFNKQIAETLKLRCPSGVNCSTFHSLGLRALKNSKIVPSNVKIDGRKVSKLVWDRMERDNPDVRDVIKLVGLAKGSVDEQPNYLELCARHDIDISDKSLSIANEVFWKSSANKDVIDFDDMLWMSVFFDARFDLQDFVFVDEAQDTNDIQVEILSRLQKPSKFLDGKAFDESSTRFIIVGDPRQAIYGFRGANSDSMTRLQHRFSCVSYPLSVSYRCPKAVVNEARKYLTHI